MRDMAGSCGVGAVIVGAVVSFPGDDFRERTTDQRYRQRAQLSLYQSEGSAEWLSLHA